MYTTHKIHYSIKLKNHFIKSKGNAQTLWKLNFGRKFDI